jgi:hypothetical protein
MSRSARWTAGTLLGLAAWIGATVLVAATGEDPSDATPILRTFALGGGLFFAAVLTAAAWEIRSWHAGATTRLYRRLALRDVPARTIRAAVRRTTGTAYVYLLFAGVTTGLLLAAVAGGESGPYRVLFATGFGLVLVWAGYSVFARVRTTGATGDLLAPLGLAVTGVPTWRARGYGGGGDRGAGPVLAPGGGPHRRGRGTGTPEGQRGRTVVPARPAARGAARRPDRRVTAGLGRDSHEKAQPGGLSQVLASPRHFEQATGLVTPEAVRESFVRGPGPEEHLAKIDTYLAAGIDKVYVTNIGPHHDGFFRLYADHVLPKLAHG